MNGLAITLLLLAVSFSVVGIVHRWRARRWIAAWLTHSGRQFVRRRRRAKSPRHVLFAFVDHFEPRWRNCTYEVEVARVDRWCKDYPRLCEGMVDADGVRPQHTFFYPEEEYRPEHLDALSHLCAAGYGEIEVHLHHDNDTDAGLREKLRHFTRVLHQKHGALSKDPATGALRWAFIHGNWALDNSRPDGRWCGVNNEISILSEEGCYADFTFPSAPDATQPATVNAIYYATDDPTRPRSHDRGARVRVGGSPKDELMIIQGPLGANWTSRKYGIFPRLENADVRFTQPPSPSRIDSWIRTGIGVVGRPEWIFVKIHTHGTQEPDMPILLGEPTRRMLAHLQGRYNDGVDYCLHYVSSREMYNIAKAAEAGRTGNPAEYRDFLLPRPANRTR